VSGDNAEKPLRVSVVIPAYNIGDFIARAIDSVLAQTLKPHEIIVVDDGSTDHTPAQIKKYGAQLRYIHQPNAGPNAARNTGIRSATCEWIAFLDGDDEWLPEYLQEQVALLQRNPHLVWSCGNFFRCLCEQKRRAPESTPKQLARLLGQKEFFESYFWAFRNHAGGNTDTMVIKRQVLEEAGLFLEGMRRAEDMDMWFRIAYRWPRIGYLRRPLAIYHLERPGCLSRQFTPVSLYAELIDRQLGFAARFDQLTAFKPVATHLLRRWMRSMLFDARHQDIRTLMTQFDDLLPRRYQSLMRLLTAFPRATAMGCHLISRLVRTFRLRRRLQRPPR